MAGMRFKEYEWPNNPSNVQVKWEERLHEHVLPRIGSMLERVGRKYRVITGEGDFYGSDCYERFAGLSRVFEEGGAGYLYLPGMTPIRAMFRALELQCGPTERLIHYRFEFWEEAVEAARVTAENGVHIVRPGETLWSIAAMYGQTVDELLNKNPGLRGTLSPEAGERVEIL